MELTSTRNPLLQKIRRAAAAGRPTEEGLIVAEGPHLLAEAQRGEWRVEQVFVSAAARERYHELLRATDAEIIEVSERALAATAATEAPQSVLTLLRPRRWNWADLQGPGGLVVILDRMQDPGNVGTIIRSAEAFGASGVVCVRGCARVANGKVLRAAAGSVFRIPLLEEVSERDVIEQMEAREWKLYALAGHAPQPLAAVNFCAPCALVVGNEAHGVAPQLLASAEAISIQTEKVESLNAAVACAIALYEVGRQRRMA